MLDPKPYRRQPFGREEQLYFLKAGLLILLIYFFREELFSLSRFFLLFVPFFFFCYVWFKSIHTGDRLVDILREHVTLIPVPYAEGRQKSFIPRATVALILLNVAAFYLVSVLGESGAEFVFRHFSFLPERAAGWNVLISPFSSMFLHGSAGHLWGNMISFWAFGPAVEERVGARRFLLLYFATGLLGGAASVLIFRLFLSQSLHTIGASGAIAGITGVFLVRCYFKKLVVPLPLLGLLNVKIRIHSLLLLGFFFLMDVRSGIQQLAGRRSPIAYWVHVGSMVSGMVIAARLRLHGAAAEERYTEDGLRAAGSVFGRRESMAALHAALELNPDNEAALLGLAREYAVTRRPEGRELFQRAITLKLRSSAEGAMELFKEYRDAYSQMLEPRLQYRLAAAFYLRGDHEPAARLLEAIVLEPSADDDTRQRSYFQLVILLAENNMLEAAHFRLEQFRERYPRSELLRSAEDKFVEMLRS